MTKQEDYPAQVADLISQAFDDLGDALKLPAGAHRTGITERAKLKVGAAQAAATLALAREGRIRTVAFMATIDPAAVEQAGQLPREAYMAAAVALGLAEDDGDPDERDRVAREAFDDLTGEGDPADADLGDL